MHPQRELNNPQKSCNHYFPFHDLLRITNIHTNNSYLYITFCRIRTEQVLKNKISDIAKWTNDQTQSEMKVIQVHQHIVNEKNRQL